MAGPDKASLPRRELFKAAAAGALIITVGGVEVALTPREAHAADVPLKVLTAQERETLEAVGEALLPGAKAAGLANFVDHQLAVPPGQCLLGVRLSDTVLPPYADYYRALLAAIDGSCRALYGAGFAGLSAEQKTGYLRSLPRQTPWGWQGKVPPAAAFASLRGDCLDIVYGVPEGFAALGLPYMAHIQPESLW